MKKYVLLYFAFISYIIAAAQCSIEHWSLEKRINESKLVLEAKVIAQKSLWDNKHKLIYTLSTLESYKVFKGVEYSSRIQVITAGGSVGLEALSVHPELELQVNDVGIYLLKKSEVDINHEYDLYAPTASVQSFIAYSLTEYKAFDLQKTFNSIPFELYPAIQEITEGGKVIIKSFDPEAGRKVIRPLANPSISSFSVDTLTSGTSTVLTINGSNFGFARGNGKVGFKDANYGDGRYYYSPRPESYISWSNSKIEITVPTRAGTGTVEVVNNLNESGESSTELEIEWAHLNVLFSGTNDTLFYEIDHVNDNAAGGYTWQMTPNFASNQDAVNAFTRSLEEWRCETQMNWTVGNTTDADSIAGEDVNVVRFTNFGDSRLGVCYSWYTGCFSGGSINWYVKELDIEFDSTRNWYYGTGSPTNNQLDFETVATHELGHGHQLGHVRASSKVMFYSLGPGQRKVDLVATDIEGGNYVKTKSIASSPCGPSSMQAVSTTACLLSPPMSQFAISDTLICPGDNIIITNTTETGDNTYLWNFGQGANPSSATTYGPHAVSYTNSGTKTIRLIATNFIGSDTLEKEVFVKVNALDAPNTFIQQDSSCLGDATYQVDAVANAESYLWTTSTGGSIIGANNQESATVNWSAGGIQTVSVKAINECTESNVTLDDVFVINYPNSSYEMSPAGTSVLFSNTSTEADSYVWFFGDGSTSTETNPLHEYPDKGQYTVRLISSNECGDDTMDNVLILDFRVSVPIIAKRLSVYPNPVKKGELITIKGEQFDGYTVYTMQGKRVMNGKIIGNSIKLDAVAAGSYIVLLQSNARSTTHFPIQVIE